jgi:hypothetical protein
MLPMPLSPTEQTKSPANSKDNTDISEAICRLELHRLRLENLIDRGDEAYYLGTLQPSELSIENSMPHIVHGRCATIKVIQSQSSIYSG